MTELSAPIVDDPSIPVEDITDLDVYKARVLAVAREEGEDRGWCDTIDDICINKLGLADYYPPKYAIQRQADDSADWAPHESYDQDRIDVGQIIARAKNFWDSTIRHGYQPVTAKEMYFVVGKDTDLDAALQQMREHQAKVGTTIPHHLLWPRYRAVVAKRNGEVFEVLWSPEETFEDTGQTEEQDLVDA